MTFELIDRDDERSLFTKIVQDDDGVRLLSICTGQRRGKSRLMDWFENEAQISFDMPVGRVEMTDLQDRSAFGFADHLAAALKDSALDFPKFDYLVEARAAHDWSVFQSRSPSARGQVNAGGATLSSSFIANSVGTAVLGGAELHQHFQGAQTPWTPEQHELAKERCAEGFLEDIRLLSVEQRMLLMVDAWEHCPPRLQKWIQKRLLINHALSDTPTRLTVVLAGTSIPEAVRRAQRVHVLDSLSRWSDAHIERFLDLQRVDWDAADVAMVRKGLDVRGWSFDDVEDFVALMRRRDR